MLVIYQESLHDARSTKCKTSILCEPKQTKLWNPQHFVGKRTRDCAAHFKYALSVLIVWMYEICFFGGGGPAAVTSRTWDARLLKPKHFQDYCHVCTLYSNCCSWGSAILTWFLLQLFSPAANHVKFPLHLSVLRLVRYVCHVWPLNSVRVHCEFLTCRPNAVLVCYSWSLS